MATTLYTRCPKCQQRIDILSQLAAHARDDAKDIGEAETNMLCTTCMGSLFCTQCGEYTVAFALMPREQTFLAKAEKRINKERASVK
ncbi:MAG: hypothetical protein EPO21_21875 [Chloroflexota bacterium]|nr:MAG: hypothetical protein EPO21_21875 [Chloroflexota bacterium]